MNGSEGKNGVEGFEYEHARFHLRTETSILPRLSLKKTQYLLSLGTGLVHRKGNDFVPALFRADSAKYPDVTCISSVKPRLT